ncbi:hypothetical protein [Nocardiopsis gilva]|uniref:hypothetical protein n=1 Tax=Nocardiopsis gilva TaxID=280236 RepID=UPI0012FD467A|nr:hypothetical protein [Nocardiopsis gilva]
MSVDERLRVPIGEASGSWSTLPDCRRVLVVAHTVTSMTRLLDILPLLESDPRIQIVFTRARTSNFREGVTEYLNDLGVVVAPWEQAIEEEFDLAISASFGDDMHAIKAPLAVVSHGAGYNKLMETETGNRKPETGNRKPETGNRKPETATPQGVFGLSSATLIRNGQLVPSMLVLSHPEQLDRLREACPQAVDAAVVAGDPTYDRILEGRRWRSEYRKSLDVGERRLVLVSSTWGPSSLLGRRPELLSELLEELPVDEYRVAFAAHPNTWHGHGPWQVRYWLASCERAGLRVLPPRHGWQAAVAAADHIIGDHGSVTFYGAAIGTHTMLGTFPDEELAEDSPIAEFGRTARRLTHRRSLLDQLMEDAAVHTPGRFDASTRMLSSLPGQSGDVLRAAFYRLLGLPEPRHRVRIVPPERPTPYVRTWPDVGGLVPLVVSAEGDDMEVRVERRPAALVSGGHRVLQRPHVVASADEPDSHWLDSADILVCGAGGYEPRHHDNPVDPWERISRVFSAHPNARFAVMTAPGECLVATRGNKRYRLSSETDSGGIDPLVFASAFWRVHTHLRGEIVSSSVKVGVGQHQVVMRVVPETREAT